MTPNTIAEVLLEIASEYHSSVTAGGVECRLVIPGVTDQVAYAVQEGLVKASLPSYLVIPREASSPSEQKRWIYADSLTSVRQGAMIIVTCPGELARIQDSVIGAGGAIRSFAFSDEWPWVDDGIEYFKFHGPFVRRLASRWTSDAPDQEWFFTTVSAMVRATAASVMRTELLFDDLLSTFSSTLYPALSTVREKFLFHCGIPRPDDVAGSSPESWPSVVREIERLGRSIFEAHSQAGKRNEVLERADEIEVDPAARNRLRARVETFFDGLSSQGDRRLAGVLALRGCWGNDRESWIELGVTRLQQLFDVSPGQGALTLKLATKASPGLDSASKTESVLFEGGTLVLEVVYDGIPPGQLGDFKLLVSQRQRELSSTPVAGGANTWTSEISYERLFETTAAKRAIRVQLLRRGNVMLERRAVVYPCGTNAPFLAVLEPGFFVLAPCAGSDEEEVEKVLAMEPVTIYLLRHETSVDPELERDGEQVTLKTLADDPKILVAESVLDPAESPTGQLRLRAELESQVIEADLEARDVERGDYTLEREFIFQLARGRRDRVAKLIDIFSGNRQEGYASLGGLSDQTRQRARFARAFEDEKSEGLPVIADLLRPQGSAELQREAWLWRDPDVALGSLGAIAVSAEVGELLAKYAAARKDLISTLCNGFTHDPRWPKYAFLPTYVENRRTILEAEIAKYLQAYGETVAYLRDKRSSVQWAECFLLAYLDCVVQWADNDSKARVFLLGPWHPLVVSKRFMVQAALLSSGRRYKGTQDQYRFHRLAVLLDQVSAFKWQLMLSPDDRAIELAYVSATSDPGWLLAMSPTIFAGERLGEVVAGIRRVLGLEAGLVPAAREQMATAYMRDFLFAYPSRRALSVRADSAYAPGRIVESATSLLYDKEGGLTRLGNQLPGGIHLFLPSTTELEPIQWRTPPVCVYDLQKKVPSSAFRDLQLLPPARPKGTQAAGSDYVPLPRGDGDRAVFCAPVRRVTTGAAGTPVTSAHELDLEPRDGADVGCLFVTLLATIAGLSTGNQRINWSYELPLQLEYMWNVLPGSQADPAAFVEYIRAGDRLGQLRALWDYSMSLTGALNSYFVLSLIPEGIASALNGSAVFLGKDVAHGLVRELGEIGIAIGSESMRSGSKALGVIGVVAATRLFLAKPPHQTPLVRDENKRGFLIPVDSFKDILGGYLEEQGSTNNQRADLLAVQLEVDRSRDVLKMSFCAIECKYSSSRLSDEAVDAAFTQAHNTYDRLLALAEVAKTSAAGVPERLALLALVGFGVRLSSEETRASLLQEYAILDLILRGQFEIVPPQAMGVVVSTECSATDASLIKRRGWWIRLAPGHWPGIAESSSLDKVRGALAALFRSPRDSSDGAPPIPTPTTKESEVVAVTAGENAPEGPRALPRLLPVLLGTDNKNSPVLFDPQSEQSPLDNYNMMITGSSGKGKTQLIKTVVCGMRAQERDVLLLDFKNDFASDVSFLGRAKLNCRYITFDGLPYNPLIPVPVRHPGTGQLVLQASQHISGISSVLTKTFGLGPQQEAALKEVIRDCFKNRGIDPGRNIALADGIDYPDFNDVGLRLRQSNPLAYNRMDPLFDLGVFPSEFRLDGFESLLAGASVLDLSQIQSDAIKNAVAKIVILSAHSYYNAREHSGVLRQFFVFDEGHRVLDSEYLVKFVRECRAYGVGVLLSSQYPSDFPQEVSASLNTKIVHGNGNDRERVRDIQKLLGTNVEEQKIGMMGLFQAYVSNAHYNAVPMRTLAYPQYLALDALRRGDRNADGSLNVAGLDQHRLSIPYLLELLRQMGLVEEKDGVFRARSA